MTPAATGQVLKSEKMLKLIGAIDDRLLEKSTNNVSLKSSYKPKVTAVDESNELSATARYEESLRIISN